MKSKEEAVLTPDKAKELLEEDLKRRHEECSKRVNAILVEYGMAIRARPGISDDGRITVQIGIVPLPQT